MLLCDPAATPVTPLADALLLTPTPSTQAFREHAGLARMTLADALA